MSKLGTACLLFMGLSLSCVFAAEDVIIEDFETKRLDWKFSGDAFAGYGGGNYWHPGRFDRGMLRTRGHRGYAMLKSWGHDGRDVDGRTGSALSLPFKLERKFIRFMMSGGKAPGKTCVNLLMDGKIVRSATGNNSNQLEAVAFDVSPLMGKEVQIEVVDRETGPWGHVCIDDLIQSDKSTGARIANETAKATPDVLWSQTGRQAGDLKWIAGKLHLNEKPVHLEGIVSISRQADAGETPPTNAIRFKNGETWRGEILSLSKNELTLKGELFKQRTVDFSSVSSLEFKTVSNIAGISRPGILYRNPGRPIPGKLLGIDKENVTVDCAFGIIPIPRTGLTRYLVPGSAGQENGALQDEIGLKDGSVLRGDVRFENAQVIVEHLVLGTLTISWENLRYLIRSSKERQWLTNMENESLESHGPLGSRTGVKRLDLRNAEKGSLSIVRISPQTILRYPLESNGQSERVFRAKLIPMPGNRGDATITLSVAGKTFFKKAFSNWTDPEDLDLKLPDGKELSVTVAFGEQVSYPCGVDLHDAHLIGAGAKRTGGQKP